MHDARFLKCFRALSNVVKYIGGANDDLFIIQFLPIYLADSARAWLDHLPRNVIDD
jgi:hypothetical protein